MPKQELVDAIASLANTKGGGRSGGRGKQRRPHGDTAKDRQRSKLVKRAFADACIAERKFENEKERLADGTSGKKKELRVEHLPG